MSARLWAAAAVLLLALGGCGGSDDDEPSTTSTSEATEASPTSAGSEVTPPSAAELNGRTYEATSVEGYELIPGTTLRVGFDSDNLVARAGCNTLTGPYSFDGGTLKWSGPPASTMIGCPDELVAQDEWLTDLFTTGVSATVDQFGANLTNGEVTIQLIRDDGEV
jgi:heat shock protein HslJ